MSLKVIENQGVFHVNGTLDCQNVQILNQQLSKYFRPAQRVILNLEQVVEFDSMAAYTLMKMFINAVHSNSKFSIIGMKNKKLLHILKETKTINIWCQTKSLK